MIPVTRETTCCNGCAISSPRQETPRSRYVCWGYDRAEYNGDLDRDMLDEISDTIPISVTNYAPHISYVNSAMLKLIGQDESTKVQGIGRYPDGRLNGWFVEHPACALMGPLKDIIFPPGVNEKAIQLHAQHSVGVGVTTAVDMAWGLFDFDGEWATADKVVNNPASPIRVSMVPYEPNLSKKFGDKRFDYLDKMCGKGTDRLQVHGIKFQMDGSYPATTSMIGYPGYLDEDTGRDRRHQVGRDGRVVLALLGTRHPHSQPCQRRCHPGNDAGCPRRTSKPQTPLRSPLHHRALHHLEPEQAYRLAALGGAASVNAYFPHYRALLHSNYAYGPDRAEATRASDRYRGQAYGLRFTPTSTWWSFR